MSDYITLDIYIHRNTHICVLTFTAGFGNNAVYSLLLTTTATVSLLSHQYLAIFISAQIPASE